MHNPLPSLITQFRLMTQSLKWGDYTLMCTLHKKSTDHKQRKQRENIHRNRIQKWGVLICTAPIHFYRRYISPLTPPSCRFVPTCSQYALDAYRIHGTFRGTWLTFTRILRCHPWHPGGNDPVVPYEQKK
jgi:hypothetical protein